MTPIHITNDLIPVARFKTRISKNLNEIKVTERPIIITQNGKPAAVMLATGDYDELVYQKSLIESITRIAADIETNDLYTTDEIMAEPAKRRSQMSIRWTRKSFDRLVVLKFFVL